MLYAPRSRACCREVEPDEAVEYGVRAAVHNRQEALRKMSREIGYRHFTRKEKGDRAREEANKEKRAAEHFEDSGDSYQGRERNGAAARHPDWKCKEFHRADRHKEKCGNDAKHALKIRGPHRPSRGYCLDVVHVIL